MGSIYNNEYTLYIIHNFERLYDWHCITLSQICFPTRQCITKRKKEKQYMVHAYKLAHHNTITLSIVLHVICYCINLYFIWHYFIFYFYKSIQFVQNWALLNNNFSDNNRNMLWHKIQFWLYKTLRIIT